MGDDSPSGKNYVPEQIVATTQALERLYGQLSLSPPRRLSTADMQNWHAELAAPLGVAAGRWREGPMTFGSYFGTEAAAI